MKKTSYTFKNISAFHRQFGLPEPENPLFSILRSAPKEPEANSNEQPLDNAIMEITCEYYAISLKTLFLVRSSMVVLNTIVARVHYYSQPPVKLCLLRRWS